MPVVSGGRDCVSIANLDEAAPTSVDDVEDSASGASTGASKSMSYANVSKYDEHETQ